MRRCAHSLGRFLAGAAVLALCACPGRLKDPEQYLVSCPAGTSVETDIFTNTCGVAGCHNATTLAGGLDLATADPASRVINKPSSTCMGLTLIGTPDSGFLFDKLAGTPSCGSPMPLAKPPLTADQIQCIVEWATPFFDGGTL